MLDEANPLVDAGFSIIPLKPRTKRPVAANWTELPTHTKATLARAYRKGQNVGVRLGEPSIVEGLHLYTIDLDVRLEECADEAWAALKAMFPKVRFNRLPTVKSGSGGKSRHIYFLCDGLFRSHKLAHSGEKFTDDAGKEHWTWEIEFFGTGKQVALPPSIHPDTGKPYVWIKPLESLIVIPEIDAEVIEDLIAPDEVYQHDNADALGISFEEAEDALAEIQDWADDHTSWVRAGMALHHEFGEDGWELFDSWSRRSGKYNRRENKFQWDRFKEDRKNVITMRSVMSEANERSRTRTIFEDFEDLPDEDESGDEESAPEDDAKVPERGSESDPINVDHREILKDFPKHLLRVPGVLQDMVDHYNQTAIKPQPQFAVLAAIALGSVVVARNHVTDWDNYSSLYLLAVGRSGSGKEHLTPCWPRALSRT